VVVFAMSRRGCASVIEVEVRLRDIRLCAENAIDFVTEAEKFSRNIGL
jgi:hypothetical protein